MDDLSGKRPSLKRSRSPSLSAEQPDGTGAGSDQILQRRARITDIEQQIGVLQQKLRCERSGLAAAEQAAEDNAAKCAVAAKDTLRGRTADALRIDRVVFDWNPGQESAIRARLAGRDVLGILPTGSGKTMCWLVPLLVAQASGEGRRTRCTVLVPLRELMHQHHETTIAVLGEGSALSTAAVSLGAKAKPAAAAALSAATGESSANVAAVVKTMRFVPKGRDSFLFKMRYNPKVQVIYTTPEKHAGWEDFRRTEIELMIAGLFSGIVVDEAHCVSTWGHDFRPVYRQIGQQYSEQLSWLPYDHRHLRAPICAYSGTATLEVERDIVESLGMRDPVVVRCSIDRPNLIYLVHHNRKEIARSSRRTTVLAQLVDDGLKRVRECTSVKVGSKL